MMDLINDLSNDVAFTFLVERKKNGDLTSREVRELLDRIRIALSPVEPAERRENIERPIHLSNAGH